jgi:uncharacterized protein YdeI (BOF family)
MKKTLLIILTTIVTLPLLAQEEKWCGQEFNSVFQSLTSGQFDGTVNGIITLKNAAGVETILDFQAGKSNLVIEKNEYAVYDVSTKRYTGYTTSGKTKIQYRTYASANGIGVQLNGQLFENSTIDGACWCTVQNIVFDYKQEPGMEYLVLIFEKEVKISNWQYLLRTKYTEKPDNLKELKQLEQEQIIMPKSILTFAIKRT